MGIVLILLEFLPGGILRSKRKRSIFFSKAKRTKEIQSKDDGRNLHFGKAYRLLQDFSISGSPKRSIAFEYHFPGYLNG